MAIILHKKHQKTSKLHKCLVAWPNLGKSWPNHMEKWSHVTNLGKNPSVMVRKSRRVKINRKS